MVLYSAVSSPLDRSKRFTLSSPGRPVHSDTVLGFSWKHSSHAAIAQRLFTHISTTVYSQVLIYTAESTEDCKDTVILLAKCLLLFSTCRYFFAIQFEYGYPCHVPSFRSDVRPEFLADFESIVFSICVEYTLNVFIMAFD